MQAKTLIQYLPTTLLLAVVLLAFAVVIDASDSSTVAYGLTNQSITAFSTCKKVTNNSPTTKTVYVPTVLSGEWSSFYTHPPMGITIGTCVLPGPITFNHTGANQFYTVPDGVTTVRVQLWGAGGGSVGSGAGGAGGYTEGNLNVTPGSTLTVVVGGAGGSYVAGNSIGRPGGFGGGGNGGNGAPTQRAGLGGGGRSAIIIGTSVHLVAGGGGGAGSGNVKEKGGRGGGLSGGSTVHGGAGGTQTAGGAAYYKGTAGSFGAGGDGADASGIYGGDGGCGGGGGYYGGGGGATFTQGSRPGGGGSGYCDGLGVSNCTTTLGTGSAAATHGQVIITPINP